MATPSPSRRTVLAGAGASPCLLAFRWEAGVVPVPLPSVSVAEALSRMSALDMALMVCSSLPERDMLRGRLWLLCYACFDYLVWRHDNREVAVTLVSMRDCLRLNAIEAVAGDTALTQRQRLQASSLLGSIPGYGHREGMERSLELRVLEEQHGYRFHAASEALDMLMVPMPGLGRDMMEGQVDWPRLRIGLPSRELT